MSRNLLQVVLLVVAVVLALVVEPRYVRADSRLRGLHGSAVVVTSRAGAVGSISSIEPGGRIRTAMEAAARERVRKAKLLRNVGIGITVSGIAIFVGGWLAALIQQSLEGIVVSGMVVGTGGGCFTLGVGVPIWIAGAVRYSLSRSGRGWKSRRRAWTIGGLTVTITGGALATVGVGLLGSGLDSGTPGIVTGSVFVAVGLFASVFVGIPMWVTAYPFTGETPPHKNDPVVPRPVVPRRIQGPIAQTLDSNHEARLYSRLTLGNPRPTVFSTGFRF